MSEYFKDEGKQEPTPEELGVAEAEEPQEVQFRVVRLEPEDPDAVRKRNGLHAGGMVISGTQRLGSKAPKKDWT